MIDTGSRSDRPGCSQVSHCHTFSRELMDHTHSTCSSISSAVTISASISFLSPPPPLVFRQGPLLHRDLSFLDCAVAPYLLPGLRCEEDVWRGFRAPPRAGPGMDGAPQVVMHRSPSTRCLRHVVASRRPSYLIG